MDLLAEADGQWRRQGLGLAEGNIGDPDGAREDLLRSEANTVPAFCSTSKSGWRPRVRRPGTWTGSSGVTPGFTGVGGPHAAVIQVNLGNGEPG